MTRLVATNLRQRIGIGIRTGGEYVMPIEDQGPLNQPPEHTGASGFARGARRRPAPREHVPTHPHLAPAQELRLQGSCLLSAAV